MRKVLKEKHFVEVEEVKQKVAEAQKGIKTHYSKNWLEPWEKRLDRGIVPDGEYFEGD